jgi:precorrin-4/cobalt-precorrin-4 C11-methyltransferase
MQYHMLTLCILCLAVFCAGTVFGLKACQAARGKFYIVGMGTAPDLITIRGVEVIRSADIILVGNEQERELWNVYTRNKEVWYCPDWIRILYGIDPLAQEDPQRRALSERGALARKELAGKIRSAVEQGKTVVFLQAGDPMMHGLTLLLEILPKEIPAEVVPGVGAFQAASAALKMSPPYGYDTSAVILTMADWPGRADANEKLMTAGSTMVFYTMLLDYPKVFSQLQRHYPVDTPVAVVVNAGDHGNQRIIQSSVGRFLKDVDYRSLPVENHILFVGKFLEAGQVRKDFVPQTEGEHTK